MTEKENPMKNAELSTEQNYNNIDGIVNNLPLALPPTIPVPDENELEKVKEQTEKKRQRTRGW